MSESQTTNDKDEPRPLYRGPHRFRREHREFYESGIEDYDDAHRVASLSLPRRQTANGSYTEVRS